MSADDESRSTAELTGELTEQTSRLAQEKIEPAKLALSARGRS